MILKKTHLLCNMIFYPHFCVIDISIASGFQRSRSPKVLHHKWHRMHRCQALRLQQLKRSTFILKLLFAIFFLLIVRLCHLEPFTSHEPMPMVWGLLCSPTPAAWIQGLLRALPPDPWLHPNISLGCT